MREVLPPRRIWPSALGSWCSFRTALASYSTPHRFRHTFATDMVRAGVSLPALMRLMGHANIQTTLMYVEVTPIDV